MNCIYCGNDTKVTNSRPQKRLNHIWRRRQCLVCGGIFTTSEAPDTEKSLSFSTDKKLAPFSRDQLLLSIYDSLRHRTTAVRDAAGLADTIISRSLTAAQSGVIERDDVVAIAQDTLARFDTVAATHYGAFHKL